MKYRLQQLGIVGVLMATATMAAAQTPPMQPATPVALPELNLPGAPLPVPPAPAAMPPAMQPPMPANPAAPVPVAPAAMVPEMPAMPAGANASALPVLPQEPAAKLPEVPQGGDFSFGTAPYSLMYSPSQIANMKKSLTAYENIRFQPPPPTTNDGVTINEAIQIAPPPAPVQEPTTYPVFQLSSIVYRDAGDWAVWVNGTRITPASNNGEVKVTAVNKDRAWFDWEPEYKSALQKRIEQKDFADSKSVKHRMALLNTVHFNDKKQIVEFSLRPNQTFAPGYFQVFEGRIAPPTLPIKDAAAEAAAMFAEPTQPEAAPDSTPAAAAPKDGEAGVMSPATADAINGLLDNTPPAVAPVKPAPPPVAPAAPTQ